MNLRDAWLSRRRVPQMLELERACFPPADRLWDEAEVEHLALNSAVRVYFDDTAILAYLAMGRGWEVVRIAVHPEYQRHGIGRAMLEWAAAEDSPSPSPCGPGCRVTTWRPRSSLRPAASRPPKSATGWQRARMSI